MSIVRAKKHLGQHFLKDQNIACKITASLLPVTKGVLEIGPGMGVLTRHLLKDTKFSVLAIDIDQESIDYLHEELPAHKEQIIYGDFLKSNIRNFYTEPFSIIGNLPYNISSQIFFRILENRDLIPQVVCMIQKEVAERLSAPVGTKEYGQITVLLNYHFNIEKIIDVDRKAFYPTPNVDSAVIKMIRKDNLEDLTSFEHFDKLVKDSFQFKRKTIKNNLINKYNLDIVSKVLEKYGYDLSMRSEKIPYYVFVEISNELLK